MTTATIDYSTWTSLGNSIPAGLEWLKDKVAGFVTKAVYDEHTPLDYTSATVIKASNGPDAYFDNALLSEVRPMSSGDHYLVYHVRTTPNPTAEWKPYNADEALEFVKGQSKN